VVELAAGRVARQGLAAEVLSADGPASA